MATDRVRRPNRRGAPLDLLSERVARVRAALQRGPVRAVRSSEVLVTPSASSALASPPPFTLRIGRYRVQGLTGVLDELCAYDPVRPAEVDDEDDAEEKVEAAGRKETVTTAWLRRWAPARGKLPGTKVDRELLYYLDRRQLPDGAHVWTRMMVEATRRWGWTPVAGQVPVGCVAWQVGTLVDGLFVDEDGRLVLVEFKTGCAHWDEARSHGTQSHGTRSAITRHTLASGAALPTPFFRRRLQTVQTYCQLQTAATLALFRKTFPTLDAPAAYLVRVNHDGVDRHRIETWAGGVVDWLAHRATMLLDERIVLW